MAMIAAGADAQLEARTRRLGRRLFAAVRRHDEGADGWLDRRLMQFSMRDERVKAQLFRFVDVLPALRSPAQINGHLREYLSDVRDALPLVLAKGVDWLPRDG